MSEIIVENKIKEGRKDVEDKVYTRDMYSRDKEQGEKSWRKY